MKVKTTNRCLCEISIGQDCITGENIWQRITIQQNAKNKCEYFKKRWFRKKKDKKYCIDCAFFIRDF